MLPVPEGRRLDRESLELGDQAPGTCPATAAYAATKDAIRQLTRAAACEWVVDGIRTNVPLHKEQIFRDTNFENGGVDIHYLETKLGLKK